jgi:uncharacterized membrane-anchored protein YitT (DUF2179 family)
MNYMNLSFWDMEKNDIARILCAVGGMLIFALGINLFIVPAGLYNGGVLGLSQIIRTLLVRYGHLNMGGTDVAGIINLALNIPLFILAYRSIGRGFFLRTLICVGSQTLFLTLIPIPTVPLVEDTLTACVIGGIIGGAGIGIALRNGGSGGGTDILGIYLTRHHQGFSVGRLALTVNLVIYTACALLFDITVVIYCIIYTAVSTLMMDRTHTQNINTQVFIFTKEDPGRVMKYILKDLERGATYWKGRGGYTEEETNIIFSVVSKHELALLKKNLREVDPQAFLVSKENVGIEGRFLKHL